MFVEQVFEVLSFQYSALAVLLLVSAYLLQVYTFSSLSRIPGPWFTKFSSLWLSYHNFIGDEILLTHKFHEKYGPIVRLSPNDIDIADGEALWPIYMDKGGFEKSSNYQSFDIDGHSTIFSSQTLDARASRVKTVLPIFAMGAIRDSVPMINEAADKFVLLLRERAQRSGRFDLVDISRAFALDAVSAYIFYREFGALGQISASSVNATVDLCMDTFAATGKLFYLPRPLARILETLEIMLFGSQKLTASTSLVNQYLKDTVEESKPGSYQARLNTVGISAKENISQCKDALFAGTDSTGNSLASTLWYLAKYPHVYVKLAAELASNPDADPITLPYLNGVIKETLRLSMVIATRLPRVVPPSGWTYTSSTTGESFHLPGGTVVGVPAYSLHLSSKVFPDPEKFLPERWAKPSTEMNRDWLPFGKGARSCIARNLAIQEVLVVVAKVVRSGALEGKKPVGQQIEKLETFFTRVKGGKIELE